MYDMCRYEQAWNRNVTCIWCLVSVDGNWWIELVQITFVLRFHSCLRHANWRYWNTPTTWKATTNLVMVRQWIGKFNVRRSVIWCRIWNSVLIPVSLSILVSRHRFCCISLRWAHFKMKRNWRQKAFSKWRRENGAPAKWVRLPAILRPFGTVQNKWNSFLMKNRFRSIGVQVEYANWLMYDEHTKNSMIAIRITAQKTMIRNPFLDYYSSQFSKLDEL